MQDSNQPGWTFQPGQTVSPGGTATAASPPPQTPQPAQAPAAPAPQAGGADVSWTASEFVSYQKSGGWYFLVLLVALAVSAVIYILTRDIFATVTIIVAAVLFLVYAGRKPRVLNYSIDNNGVRIGQKLYPYGQFRSFSVIDEGSVHSIMLVPLKRFMPSISMYYEPKDEEKIIVELSKYMPHEDRKQDSIDKFMHRIRF